MKLNIFMVIKNLLNKKFPKIPFQSTLDVVVPASNSLGWVVLYFHPMISDPMETLPKGWMGIPGAVGCTGQSCSFRDLYTELRKEKAEIFGVSTQTREEQLKAKKRLGLPFELINDEQLILKNLLELPTFYINGKEYYERMTLILNKGIIQKVFYPVPFPQTNGNAVLKWLSNPERKNGRGG